MNKTDKKRYIYKVMIGAAVVSILVVTNVLNISLSQGVSAKIVSEKKTIESRSSYTHTVLAEEASGTWCQYCPPVMQWMHNLYTSGQYNFCYVSLVEDQNSYAHSRCVSEYNIYGYPTVYYDGGYQVAMGAESQQAEINALNAAGARVVPNIALSLNALWLGNAHIGVTLNVTNNRASSYGGHIHVYITEINSRWYNNNGGHYQYHFAMIGNYALNQNVNVPAGNTNLYTSTWNGNSYGMGNIVQSNIMVIATVFNLTAHTGYSYPPNQYPFTAHWADNTTAAMPNAPPNTPATPTGPTQGITGKPYAFSAQTTDPDGDRVQYGWDWNGDGVVNEWTSFVASGTQVTTSHSCTLPGTYTIQVKARDIYGAESGWSTPLSVKIVILGDMNLDGAINAFDIDPFILALTDPIGYQNQYNFNPVVVGDINQDGLVNAFDIDPFIQLLTGK